MKISDRRLWSVLLGCLGILGMAVVNGCTCAEEPAPPPQPTPQAAQPTPQAAQPTPPAPTRGPRTMEEQLAEEVELPPRYPEDAPVYPGARINSGTTRGARVQAVFSTPDSRDQVVEWYRTALGEQGWENLSEVEAGEHRVIRVDQGSRRLGLMFSSAGGQTLIVVSSDL